jgi:hypothetical protein
MLVVIQRRLLICLSFVIAVSTSLSAPITAAPAGEKVRFSAGADVAQIRLQIVASNGEAAFDSAWRDGNVFDWPIESPGHPLTDGSYRCTVTVKNLDGQTTQREATLTAQNGKVSIEGLTPAGDDETGPKITLPVHDEKNGAIVNTSGDLIFSFGNFFAGKDIERMRLTADGNLGIGTDKPQAPLDVHGLIRTSEGIMFPDGTILTTAAGNVDTIIRQRPSAVRGQNPRAIQSPTLPFGLASVARPKPRPNFAPAYQFVVNSIGVTIGTTNPAYQLDVAGPINTATQYNIGGARILAGDLSSTIVGAGAGTANPLGGITLANSFFGQDAGHANANGIEDAFFGSRAGQHVTDGEGNTFIGENTGYSATTESFNTLLGESADITPGITNGTAIGYYALAAQSNTVVLGSINGVNTATATTSTGIATNRPNQYLAVGGGITVDANSTNNGTFLSNAVLAFGAGANNIVSGEGIASQRTASGGNQYGLDFYTLYNKRMSITNNGNVTIFGTLSKGAGSFKIDHPLDPENKYLYHSFVESPDMMNIYNGNVTIDEQGEAVVELPDWFESLNQDFRYQLTCLHGFAPVYIDEEISANHFKIAGGKPGMKVSWQVSGIRHDAYANAHRIQVEEDKPAGERGTFLHPIEHGQPRDAH